MKVASVAACALLLLSACGDGSDTAEPNSPEPTETENVVEVGLTEYSFQMPEEVTGGSVTFDFSNAGGQPHEAGFIGIEGDHDLEDVQAALKEGEPPDWTTDLAGIPVLSPGVDISMTRELEPGRYLFLCFLPTPEGKPHAMEGMVKLFDVVGTSDAAAPEPHVQITVDEKGFDVPDLSAGTHLIEVVNAGKKTHEFAFVSFEEGKSEKDLGKWFEGGYAGDAPALFPGGIQGIEPGVSLILEMTFEPGRTYTLEDYPNDLRTEIVIE